MKICAILLGICLFLLGCKSSNPNNKYEFDIKTINWSFTKDFEIKDIVKNIQYILLEETPESIFSGIYKLIIKNDRIYILDIAPKSLLVFDIKGNFLHKIGRQGGGPGEFTNSIINFAVDENDMVFLYDYAKKRMMKYDKDGKYIETYKSSFSFNDFLLLPNGQYMLSLDIYEKNNNNRKIVITDDLKKGNNAFFHFSENYVHDKLNMVTFQPFGDKIAYMRPVNDSLFIFDNNGSLKQAWLYDFGDKKLEEKLKNNYEKAVVERGNSTYIFNTPICIKNYIVAEMIANNQKYISVYDTAKNRLTHEVLEPDKFSLYNINTPLCTMSDSLLVSYLDAETYYYVKDHFSVSPEIDEHLDNGGTIILLNTIK